MHICLHGKGSWDVVPQAEHQPPTQKGVHPLRWRPLKYRRVAWHTWLSGLQSGAGYRHYATFWRDELSRESCAHCQRQHNTSVYGVPAHRDPSHLQVHTQLSGWNSLQVVGAWEHRGPSRRITGRPAIPKSRYVCHGRSRPCPQSHR